MQFLIAHIHIQLTASSIDRNPIAVADERKRSTVLRLGRNVGIYERASTTQQEVVQAITAGIPTKVAGITSTDPVVA